ALDAMGGDNAPRVEVEGAAQALRELPRGFVIQLVGRTADIEAALKAHGDADRARLQIVEAPDVVGMGEKPLAAVKSKPRSSIAVGLGLQKQGDSDAFISAGNTGAVMAAATLMLRLHDGVQRESTTSVTSRGATSSRANARRGGSTWSCATASSGTSYSSSTSRPGACSWGLSSRRSPPCWVGRRRNRCLVVSTTPRTAGSRRRVRAV